MKCLDSFINIKILVSYSANEKLIKVNLSSNKNQGKEGRLMDNKSPQPVENKLLTFAN